MHMCYWLFLYFVATIANYKWFNFKQSNEFVLKLFEVLFGQILFSNQSTYHDFEIFMIYDMM